MGILLGKKKLPTYLPYFSVACYANTTTFYFLFFGLTYKVCPVKSHTRIFSRRRAGCRTCIKQSGIPHNSHIVQDFIFWQIRWKIHGFTAIYIKFIQMASTPLYLYALGILGICEKVEAKMLTDICKVLSFWIPKCIYENGAWKWFKYDTWGSSSNYTVEDKLDLIWYQTSVGFTRIAVNFKFYLWFRNLKLTSSFQTTTKSYS